MWLEKAGALIVCTLFTILVWLPLGRWCFKLLFRGRALVGHSVAIALGMGGWAYLVLLLGAVGFIYRSLLLIAGIGIFLAFGLRSRTSSSDPTPRFSSDRRDTWAAALFAAIGAIYLGIALSAALAPETAFDSLNVHLPYARDAAVSHRAAFEPNNWSSVMPALPLMAYITAFVFSGATLAKLFNALCYALCAAVTFDFARRRWNRRVAAAAALLFLSCPVAIYEATTALIDLPLTLFSALAIFALLEWTIADEVSMLRLSAASLGLAMGCKYHAAFWLAPVLFVILFHSRFRRGEPLRRSLAITLQYGLIVFALYVPWLYRTWYFTGNPVFPAANGIFKSPYFTQAMADAAQAAYANEGVGVSLRALTLLPWTVTFHPGPFRGTLGYIFLPAIALALGRRLSHPVGYGMTIAGAYFYSWALSAQEIRYLLPAVPLLATLAAAGLLAPGRKSAPLDREGRGFTWGRLAAGVSVFLVVAGSMLALPWWYPSAVPQWTYWHSYQSPLPYLFGKETAQEFLKRDVPSIYVYDYINAHLDGRSRVLLLNDAARFYSRVPTLYSFTLEAERFLLEDKDARVVAGLAASRITHVLLNYNGIAPLPGVAPRKGVYFFLDRSFQERYLEPVFSSNNVVLYRVRRGPDIS